MIASAIACSLRGTRNFPGRMTIRFRHRVVVITHYHFNVHPVTVPSWANWYSVEYIHGTRGGRRLFNV